MSIGESADGSVDWNELNGTFCATVIMTCCSFALGPSETSQIFAAGILCDEACRFIERAGSPRVEDRGQHHLVFETGASGSVDWFECLQQVRDDSSANYDVECISQLLFPFFRTELRNHSILRRVQAAGASWNSMFV